MISQFQLDSINRNLGLHFGYLENQANFRLVWAPGEFETRQGHFAKFDASGNYTGTDNGIKVVPKYPMLGETYAIEKLVPLVMDEEIKTDKKLIYEAFFNFASLSGKILEPNWEVVKYIIMMALEGPKYTADHYIAQDDAAFKTEVDKFRELLET